MTVPEASSTSTATMSSGRSALQDPQRRGRMILGAVSLMISVGYLMEAVGMPRGSAGQPGPGLWPVAVGIAWIVISVLVVAEAALSSEVSGEVEIPTGQERRNVLLFLAATLGFVVLLPLLGQYIAASLYAVAVIKLLSPLTWLRAAAYGVLLGAGLSWAFIGILQIRLPVGIFGGF